MTDDLVIGDWRPVMPDRSSKSDWKIIAAGVLAVVLVFLGTYATGYFATTYIHVRGPASFPTRGGYLSFDSPELSARLYKHGWQATLFTPAARIESAITGQRVKVYALPRTIEDLDD
jgi:hypothetical protein